jgi:hypothetical protein
MSKTSRNPMELVDRYLQAVRFWVPRTRRQEELIAELGEDLRSQVEEKETELGRPLDEEEVSAILKRCGNPTLVAGRLGPKGYVIGPTLYPIYLFVLKMVLLWILVPVFIFIVGPVNLANSGGDLGAAIGHTIGNLWSGLFIAGGVITLVFAVLERTHAQLGTECKWDPSSLPPLQKQERKTSLVQAVCELVFGWFGLIWLLLLPHYPFLILGPAAGFLKPAPMWHTFYLPIVLVAVFGLLRSGMILARPQWTWLPSLSQLMQTMLSLIVLHFILNVATQTPGGTWHPFVVLADSVRDSAHYTHIAAIVNASILLSLASAWLGLCIAAIIQTWEFMRQVRKLTSGVPHTASLGVQ